jgi:hypothetical protein
MLRTKVTLLAFAILVSMSVVAWAAPADAPVSQPPTPPPADTQQVNYFVNANTGAPDGTVQLTNPGTSGGATICALIYVFRPDEEMAECCGCTLSHDDLRTLSINNDLTSNPLTGNASTLNNGTIKVVSSVFSGTCDPRAITPTPSTRGWTTHILSASTITEEENLDATLSGGEKMLLQQGCKAIVLEGSGHGICTCGSGS